MYFNTCEHYDNIGIIYHEENKDCFICFDEKIPNENKPTKLRYQNLYIKTCDCDGTVHNYCLKKWFDKHKKCPICRIECIENNNTTLIIHNYIPYGIHVYAFIQDTHLIVLRILYFLRIY